MSSLLSDIEDLVTRSIGPTVAVKVNAPPNLPAAMVDPGQLELAVLNLSINARDAMPEGGELVIDVDAEELQHTRGERLQPGRYIRIRVSDNGIGMDAATLAHAIEPFFSTKGLGKGTGLGLSMVHGLAAQSGGALFLSSTQGVGTQAELWLPTANEEASINDKPQVEAVPATRPATVLLIDDEELVRVGTAEMLMDLGYAVVQVGSGAEALGILRSGAVQIDMIVSDHLMPVMNGADVVTEAASGQARYSRPACDGICEFSARGGDRPSAPDEAIPAGGTRLAHCRAVRGRSPA